MDQTEKELGEGQGPEEVQVAFISAVAHESCAVAERWAAAGGKATVKDRYGRSALAEATMRFYQRPQEPKENLKVMRLTLALGADPNEAWGRNEEPPLHLAMAGGSVEAARELAGAGAVIGAQNAAGDTALHIAARAVGGKPHGAAYLLTLGIDPKVKNNKGRSALQDALSKNPEVASVIKAFGEAKAKMKTEREQRSYPKKAAPGQIDLFENKAAAPGQDAVGQTIAGKTPESAEPTPKKRSLLIEPAPKKTKSKETALTRKAP